jgi:hypothetical protein
MSKIHPQALERLAEGTKFNSEELRILFEEMVTEAEESESEVVQLNISFMNEGDELTPGTYVPTMWLILQKVVEE